MALCSTEGIKAWSSNFQIKANQISCNPEIQKFTYNGLINRLFIRHCCNSVNLTQSIRLSVLLLCIF